MSGSVYVYDPDRDPETGRRFKPGECPKWAQRGHKRWGFAVDLGMRYDEAKGRQVRQQLRREGFERKIDAENALDEEKPGIKLGTAPSLADRRLTVGEWADRWLASKASIRPSTRASYCQTLDAYVKPSIGHLPLTQLRADHLDAMLADIRSGRLRPKWNRRGPDGKLAASALRQIFAVVTVMLGGAVKRRLIPFSPTVGVELEPAEHRDKAVWGPEEVADFIAYAEEHEPRLAIGFRVALSYGLRRGEVCALRWSDIDQDEGRLHVRQNLPAVVGGLEFGPPKTASGLRALPLDIDPGFPAALREHRKRQLADRMRAGPAWQETGLILAGERGELVKPWRLTNRFRELVAEAGLPTITLHGCRRTANSLWAEADIPVSVRQEWGGWSDPKMADTTYMRVRPEAHDRAASQVAAYRAANGLS